MAQKFHFTIYPQECDYKGLATLRTIGNHLLNAAGMAAKELSFGIELIQAQNLTWVLSRLTIEMTRYPAQNEYIEIETWIEDCNKITSARNFKIYDSQQNIIGYACALWAMIDLATLSSNQPFRMDRFYTTYHSEVATHRTTCAHR